MGQLSNEQSRKIISEDIWLHYLNDTLLSKGIITKQMYHKMKLEINLRTQRLLKGRKDNKNG